MIFKGPFQPKQFCDGVVRSKVRLLADLEV